MAESNKDVASVRIKKARKRVFDIIQIGTQVDVVSKAFDIFIVIMIVASITVTFMQTFDQMDPYDSILHAIELFTIIVFIIEYLLRLWTSDYLYPDKTKRMAVVNFIFSFYGLVDLLTIISYFSVMDSNGFVAFRMIRAVRILGVRGTSCVNPRHRRQVRKKNHS